MAEDLTLWMQEVPWGPTAVLGELHLLPQTQPRGMSVLQAEGSLRLQARGPCKQPICTGSGNARTCMTLHAPGRQGAIVCCKVRPERSPTSSYT